MAAREYLQVRVAEVVTETGDACSLVLDAGFDYRPGQIVTVRLPSVLCDSDAPAYCLFRATLVGPRPAGGGALAGFAARRAVGGGTGRAGRAVRVVRRVHLRAGPVPGRGAGGARAARGAGFAGARGAVRVAGREPVRGRCLFWRDGGHAVGHAGRG